MLNTNRQAYALYINLIIHPKSCKQVNCVKRIFNHGSSLSCLTSYMALPQVDWRKTAEKPEILLKVCLSTRKHHRDRKEIMVIFIKSLHRKMNGTF